VEWVETTGRTLAEAKDAALDRLGVDETDAEFEVLEEAKQGLFGRLRTEARVRARIRPTSPRSRQDGRDRRRRRARAVETSSTTATAGAPDGPDEDRADDGPFDSSGSAAESAVPFAPPPPPFDPPPTSTSQGGAAATSTVAGQRRRGGTARMSNSRGDREMEHRQLDQDVALADQAEVGREFLDGLLDAFAMTGTIAVRDRPPGTRPGGDPEEIVELAISGPELGLLIGPQGATLNAIQELTRTVVFRRTGGRNGRIVVDVSGYREKRSAALSAFVQDVAAQVARTGTRTALEPMHAADRKVVHDTVNGIAGIVTVSEGEDPRRRVVLDVADA